MKKNPDIKTLKKRASSLRRSNTIAERLMWVLLRNRQFSHYKFKRQYIIAPYIVDFVCLWKRLIIELDGSVHEMTVEYDQARTHFLKSKGFRVLRFWNEAVLGESSVVTERIFDALQLPPLSSSFLR